MSHKSLSNILKIVTIIMMAGFAVLVAVVVPVVGKKWAVMADGKDVFWEWSILIWIAAIPCLIALILFWKVCNEISQDNSFSEINAIYLKNISYCAFMDATFFAIGNIVYILLEMSTLLVFAISMIVCLLGGAIGLAAVTLSRLVSKAAEMKQENDLTI